MKIKSFLFPVLLILLSAGIGSLFLYSAWTKVLPIEPFEYTLVEYLHFSWLPAAIVARVMIAAEAILGLFLILHLYGAKKQVLKVAVALLFIFNLYLVYLLIFWGNDVNCGCFGDALWISPAVSLIKNFLMILFLWILIKFHKGIQWKWNRILLPVVSAAIMGLSFILFPLPDQKPQWTQKDRFQPDLSGIYNGETGQPSIDVRKGKYIVAFLSFRCPHCRRAAKKMMLMKEKNPALPFYFFTGGSKQYEADFWKETQAQTMPHTKLDDDSFIKLTGPKFPVIYWMKNGWVEASDNYTGLSQDAIEKWLKQP